MVRCSLAPSLWARPAAGAAGAAAAAAAATVAGGGVAGGVTSIQHMQYHIKH